MGRVVSPVARWLQPLQGGLWILFLFWTAGMAIVWTWNIGDSQLERALGYADLRATIEWLIRIGDIVWFTLAAISVHGGITESEGLSTARRWALIACGGGLVGSALSAFGVFPSDKIVYGTTLGMKVGPVPFGVMLLWFVIVIGARETALRLFPKASHAQVAMSAGVLVLLTDLNLEAVAAKLRGFWFWRTGGPSFQPPSFDMPIMNAAVWCVFGTLLVWLLRTCRVEAPREGGRSWKPVIVFGLLNAVFALAQIGRICRG